MKPRKVGFFRELRHGDSDGPSLSDLIREQASQDPVKVLDYLRNGVLLVGSPGVVTDVLSETNAVIGTPDILTDGSWAWPNDLAYYVENYHVELPQEFLRHLAHQNYKPPQEADVSVEKLELC